MHQSSWSLTLIGAGFSLPSIIGTLAFLDDDDLAWLKSVGLDRTIKELREQGTMIFGICGGFQMLGLKILDPDAVEGSEGTAIGLSLLPVQTVFHKEKKTVQMEGIPSSVVIEGDMKLTGFEIHLGRTTLESSSVTPLLLIEDGNSMDTYFHGIFHNRLFTRSIFNQIRREKGLDEIEDNVQSDSERLAAHLEENIDMDTIHQWLQIEN